MFLNGCFGVAFDSDVSLRVLRIGNCVVREIHDKEDPASMSRWRFTGWQMKTRIGVEASHIEWPIGENDQTEQTENQRREESITQLTYSLKQGAR